MVVPGVLSREMAWCSWFEWGQCSIEQCINGVYPTVRRSIPSGTYCVDQRSRASQAPILFRKNGNILTETASATVAQNRLCACPFTIKSFFNSILSGTCKRNWVEITCSLCKPGSEVYLNRTGKSRLPYCSSHHEDTDSASQIYRITAGCLGVLAFIALILCFARFLLSESGRRSRRFFSTRRNRSRRLANPTTPVIASRDRNLPQYMQDFISSDLPPAYKDVLPLTQSSVEPPLPPPQTTRLLSRAPESPPELCLDADPLPSYQEVIALSSAAANMRKTILTAQGISSEAADARGPTSTAPPPSASLAHQSLSA